MGSWSNVPRPDGPLLYTQEHGLWRASDIHQQQACLPSARTMMFPSYCPIQIVGDYLELHEFEAHPSRHRVHIQRDQAPLHGVGPGFVHDIVDLGGEVVRKLKTMPTTNI